MLLCLLPGVLWLWHFQYSVDPHPVSSLPINTSLWREHSWRVRLAKHETVIPPGHLVSPLVCRGSCMSTVVLYCCCHSDSASVFCIFHLINFKQGKVWCSKNASLQPQLSVEIGYRCPRWQSGPQAVHEIQIGTCIKMHASFFESDSITNMDHMRISGSEHSNVH